MIERDLNISLTWIDVCHFRAFFHYSIYGWATIYRCYWYPPILINRIVFGFILSFEIETKHTDKVSQTIFGFGIFFVFDISRRMGRSDEDLFDNCIVFLRYSVWVCVRSSKVYTFLNICNRVCLRTNRFIDLIFASGQTTFSRNKKKVRKKEKW